MNAFLVIKNKQLKLSKRKLAPEIFKIITFSINLKFKIILKHN